MGKIVDVNSNVLVSFRLTCHEPNFPPAYFNQDTVGSGLESILTLMFVTFPNSACIRLLDNTIVGFPARRIVHFWDNKALILVIGYFYDIKEYRYYMI